MARGVAASAARGVRPNPPLNSGPTTPGRPTQRPPDAPPPTNDTTHYLGAALRDAGTSPTKGLRPRQASARQGCLQFSPGRQLSQAPCAHWATTAPPSRMATRKPAIADRSLAPPPRPGPTTPASAKPRPTPRETYTVKQGHPYRGPGPAKPSHRRPRASPSPAAPARPTPLRFSMCLALRFARRSTCFALAHSDRGYGTTGGFPHHHLTTARGLGRAAGTLPFTPLGLTMASAARRSRPTNTAGDATSPDQPPRRAHGEAVSAARTVGRKPTA